MFNLVDLVTCDKVKPYEALNIKTYQDYYDSLKSIALTLFKWEGFPPSCDTLFLEETLFTNGVAVLVNDPEIGYLTLKVMPSSDRNYYNRPLKYTAMGLNYHKEYAASDCIVIRNNALSIPTARMIELMAYRLANAERIADINVNGQKTPLAIACDSNDEYSIKKMYEEYDGNKPIFFTSKKLNTDAIKAIKTDAPFIADKLMEYKADLWSEALTRLGVNNNPNSDKRERMIVDEATSNNQLIEIMADSFLFTRQQAVDEANKKFAEDKFSISVTMRNSIKQPEQQTEEGAAGNE
jgi:hypothetical protein